MPSTATVTGVSGPGLAVTANVITGITSFTLETDNEVITFFTNDGKPPRSISIAAATTITITVSGNTYTISIS